MFRLNKGIWTLGIPAALSLASVIKHSVILFVILIVTHFIILKFIPVFKGYESVWMFIFVSISSIPLNVYILSLINEWGFLFDTILFLGILRAVLYYAVLFSIEQIIMGVVTRIVWKKQYKLLW